MIIRFYPKKHIDRCVLRTPNTDSSPFGFKISLIEDHRFLYKLPNSHHHITLALRWNLSLPVGNLLEHLWEPTVPVPAPVNKLNLIKELYPHQTDKVYKLEISDIGLTSFYTIQKLFKKYIDNVLEYYDQRTSNSINRTYVDILLVLLHLPQGELPIPLPVTPCLPKLLYDFVDSTAFPLSFKSVKNLDDVSFRLITTTLYKELKVKYRKECELHKPKTTAGILSGKRICKSQVMYNLDPFLNFTYKRLKL